MNFGQAIASGFGHYVTFGGRACRSEYWYWVLFTLIGGIITAAVDHTVLSDIEWSPSNTIFNLLCFLPSLAIGARRLHDIDRTAWWMLVLLSVVGIILLIVWACQKGTTGPNRFGSDPLGGG